MATKYVQTALGHNINDSNYKVVGHNFARSRTTAKVTYIEQTNADPVDVGAYTVSERQNYINVRIINYADRVNLDSQLLVWFKRGSSGDVVAKFGDDGRLYQLACRVLDVFQDPEDQTLYTILLSSGITNWRAVDADTTSWSASGTSSAHTLTVGGKDETMLSLTITGTAAPSGIYLYQEVLQFINPATALGVVSLCITIDTAALVLAGKLQADCDDLRIFSNGVSIARSIDAPNTDHTKVWITLNVGAGFDLPLYPGTAQVETATAAGTITGAGNVQVVVTAAGMTGTPKTLNVAVLVSDTAAVWAAKVRAALNGDAAVTAMFDVTGAGTSIILRRSSPAANDSTLNISLANGTCTGVSAAASSANTTAGDLYSVASSGDVDTLEFAHTANVKAILKAAPWRFTIVHGTEWFTVKKTATTPLDYLMTVVQRGALGTNEQAHSGGDIFSYIQFALVMAYGNLAATNPATNNANYNNTKPVFDMAQSDNGKSVYTASTLFYSPVLPHRPGSWAMFTSRKGPNSTPYRVKGLAVSGDPALGIKVGAYLKNGSWIADQVVVGWILRDKRAFTRIASATGRSYRTDTLWPGGTKLQASEDGINWDDLFSEGSPATPDTFTAWGTHTNIDLDNDACTMLRLIVLGTSEKKANGYQLFEALTMTVEYTNVPVITRLGEQDNYHLSLHVTNSASYQGQTVHDSIEISYPLKLNRPLVIDAEANEATYDGTNAHGSIELDDESRTVYLRGLPGTNTITVRSIDGHSMGTATIAANAYGRRP